MNRHVKFALRSSAFLVLFTAMWYFLTACVRFYIVDSDNILGFYYEENNSMDMVYVGGSAAFVYWEPLKAYEDAGLKSYNYAINTVQAELYKYMIKDILKSQDPEVILIDARAFQYRDVDQPPTEVAYRNYLTYMRLSPNRYQAIENTVGKYLEGESTLSYHFDIIKYHSSGISFQNMKRGLKSVFNTYDNPLKSFYFVPKVIALEEPNFSTNVETPMSEETNAILDDLLDYLKTTNKKFLFIVSPYLELKSHKENFNYVERKVKEAGFDFLDANEYIDEMQLNYDKDLYNENHVNIFGADKYTDFLEKYLLDNYNFNIKNDHSWDSYLDSWNQAKDDTKKEIINLLGGSYE